MENTFLIDSYTLENLTFTKPKKVKDFLVSKVKYSSENAPDRPFIVQFPKMTVVSLEKCVELEFKTDRGYTKKVYNGLSKLDTLLVDYISSKSEEWFEKKIPTGSVSQMYNKFLKAPKTSENNCTINFSLSKNKEFVNHRGEPIEISDISKNSTLQVIAEMKYVVFSKDSSFVQWEILTGKMEKKVNKVPKNGFVEDPEDCDIPKDDSDDEPEINSFF
jgi:hypothetical protein